MTYYIVTTVNCYGRRKPEKARGTGTYPFSSDQGSQTGLGSISTRLSDRPGTLSAVVLCFLPGAFCWGMVAFLVTPVRVYFVHDPSIASGYVSSCRLCLSIHDHH